MEVRLSPEKHAKLQAFAARIGREPSQLVVEAVDRLLEYDGHSIDAMEIGHAAELRGALPEQDEVIAWIGSMFHE